MHESGDLDEIVEAMTWTMSESQRLRRLKRLQSKQQREQQQQQQRLSEPRQISVDDLTTLSETSSLLDFGPK
eukprot:Awhi_evm1s7004